MNRRHKMVEQQLVRRGIKDPRVLEAMGRIPREWFVPVEYQDRAYDDAPINIGYEQTISQPYMTALMAASLALRGDETVLEIGAGSGYHAAVLGSLARRVYAVEVIPQLCEQASRNLASAGLDANITLICGDGSLGYPPAAPYDAISVAAGAPEVPQALLAQLCDPGRMVIPVGSYTDQDLRVITKSQGRIESYVPTLCRFVPLTGEQGWNR